MWMNRNKVLDVCDDEGLIGIMMDHSGFGKITS